MIVDIDASDYLVNDELTPRLGKHAGVQEADGAEDHRCSLPETRKYWQRQLALSGDTSSIRLGSVPINISAMIVAGVGRNVSSSDKAVSSRESTILKTGSPRVQSNISTSPPQN